MDLTGKLGKGLRTGILSTTLTGLIGCAEFEELRDDFIESTTWEMAAAKLEKKGEYEKARAMRNIGNLRIARRIAEAGRSEVNVYGSGESGGTYRGGGISVQTPLGYTVYLDKYLEVMYNGKRHLVEEINPPNIGIFEILPININDIVCEGGWFKCGPIHKDYNRYTYPHIESFKAKQPISMIGDKFFKGRKKNADLIGRLVAVNGKIYFDPEEGRDDWRYQTIPIKELDMFKE